MDPWAEISPEELKARQDAGDAPALLDIREPWEQAICALPGARLIPMEALQFRVDELDSEGLSASEGYFQIEDRDAEQRVREKVTGRILAFDERLKDVIAPVLWLLEALAEDEPFRSIRPVQRRSRVLDALKQLLLRESQRQPLILVFENLHWIDSESQVVLDLLVESLPTSRVLLLTNYRPEYDDRWASKTYHTRLRLDPLPPQDADELLEVLLGSDSTLAPLKTLLKERTEGNPFFLEESVRTLIETEVMVGEPGAYRPMKPVESIQVPATVQAVLAARIDRLPPSVKPVLQSAAVIGKDVPFVLLEAIAEEPEDELRRGLAHLQAAEFLYEISLFPELEYTFKHALTLEVAYQGLLRERRRVLHERVLGALERLFASRASEKIELLAHHAVLGEAWDRAAKYLYQAGEKALAQARPRAAASFFEGTVDALDRLGDAADHTLKLDAYLELWVTRISTGQAEGLPQLGEKAEALARALNDGPRLAKVQVRQAQALAITWSVPGTFDSAIERARQAFHRADPADLRTRSYAQYIAALSCRDLGRFGDALREFGTGIALFPAPDQIGEDLGLVIPIYVSLCSWRSEAYAAVGEFEEAAASATEALRMATEIRHFSSLTIASAYVGYVHLLRGAVPTAVTVLERGLAMGQEHELPHGITANALYLGHALLLLGHRERTPRPARSVLHPAAGREPLDTAPVRADSRAHRGACVAPHLIAAGTRSRGMRRGSRSGGGVSEGGGWTGQSLRPGRVTGQAPREGPPVPYSEWAGTAGWRACGSLSRMRGRRK